MASARTFLAAGTPPHAFGPLVEAFFLGDWRARLASAPGRTLFLVLAVLLAGFLSFKAVGNQLAETNILREDRVSLALYLDGTAYKPFVYRVLTPALVRFAEHTLDVPALVRALPGPLAAKLSGWCALVQSNPAPTCDDVAAYAAVAGMQFFVFLLLTYALCMRLFGNPLAALFGLGFTFLVVNAVLLLKLSHVYDFGVMMFVTLLLICIQRGWSIAFTLLLPLAFLTKETLVLYAGSCFLANLGRLDFARNLGLFAVQVLSFAAIHGLVRNHFEANPGLGHEYYLPGQIYFFTEQVSISWLLLISFALVLVFYRFPEKDRSLRRAAIVIVPWFVLFMIGGLEKELRVAFEVLPLLLIFAIDSLLRLVPGLPARAIA
jgi:hypothetical protein